MPMNFPPCFTTVACVLPLLLAGCVGYQQADLDLRGLAGSAPALPPGPLAFADAVTFAFRHNPELQRLAALARAAGADAPATELAVEWEGVDDMLSIAIDPVALLGLGQRGAAIDAASARGAAAVQELAVARWGIAGRIAEVYAAKRALDDVTTPAFAHDPEPFVRAGLASPTAAALARGASAMALAEMMTLESDRYGLLAELRQLLGVLPTAALTLAPVDAAFPPLPPRDQELLLHRPDVVLAVATYEVADAEFRAAVAEQWPSLMLGPDIPLRGGAVDAMALLRLPIGAGGRAAAAKERRDAARASALAMLVAATNEADAAVLHHDASEQRAKATAAMAAASARALGAAEVALAVEPDAFEPLAERAQMALRDAMERREAATANARARVRHAVEWGWPHTEVRP